MKKVILLVGAFLLYMLPAVAQDVPKAEVHIDYQYIRFAPALSGNKNVSFNGGGGAVLLNVNKFLGFKAEFTGSETGDTGLCSSTGLNCITRSANFFNYLFGPQVNFRNHTRATPFVNLLFGGSHSNLWGNVQAPGTVPVGGTTSGEVGRNAFALAFGGGLDVKVAEHIAIRVGEFDYFMTRYSGREVIQQGTGAIGTLQISNQSSFRYLAGINFLIGKK